MVPPTPPASFVCDLRLYDPLLRVRWGRHSSEWLIERQMPPRHVQLLKERPNPWKSPKGRDRWEGWRDGYVLVMFVHPDLLFWSVVRDHLAACDAHLQGGFDRLNRALDEAEEQWERDTDRHVKNTLEAASKDAADTFMWRSGLRVATPQAEPSGVESSDDVEQHEGFTVRVSKRLSHVASA